MNEPNLEMIKNVNMVLDILNKKEKLIPKEILFVKDTLTSFEDLKTTREEEIMLTEVFLLASERLSRQCLELEEELLFYKSLKNT